jgi:GAF domain-containing protein
VAVSDEQAQELAALAGVVLVQDDLPSTLVEVCRIATRVIPSAEGASVTTFPDGRPGAVSSDDWARSLDEIQFAEHEGPCLDAFRTGNAFRLRDICEDPRWPSYLPRAADLGARSMLSLPMAAEGNVIGALNIYSRQPDVFDAEAASLGEIVAAHAGLASQVAAAFFQHRDLSAQLTDAMQSRAAIEQAKGVLMALHRCTPDSAFQRLVAMSQKSNRKLRDISAEVVATASEPA